MKAAAVLDLAALAVWPWPVIRSLHPARLLSWPAERRSLIVHLLLVGGWALAVALLIVLVPASLLPLGAAIVLAAVHWHRRGRADFGRRQGLPSGALVPFDPDWRRDPDHQTHLAERYGPVSKFSPRLLKPVFVVSDLSLARRFLETHDEQIRQTHRSFTHLVPGGILRCMEGHSHRRYRALFNEVFQANLITTHLPALQAMIRAGLEEGAAAGEQRLNHRAWGRTARKIARALLYKLLYGLAPGDPRWTGLAEDFDRLHPEGHRIDIDPPVRPAYEAILARIDALVSDRRAHAGGKSPPISHLDALIDLSGPEGPDATARGNVVYLTAVGVQDLGGLFLWLLHFAGSDGQACATVRAQPAPQPGRGAASSFVRETLRMAQSEFIRRHTLAPLDLGGHSIPADHDVIIAMRAAHADPRQFPDPRRFDPRRHGDRPLPVSAYAPFGLGKHACPAGAMVIALGALYVEELVRGWDVALREPEALARDQLHWEPNGFARLVPR